jgi:hypothetical protein
MADGVVMCRLSIAWWTGQNPGKKGSARQTERCMANWAVWGGRVRAWQTDGAWQTENNMTKGQGMTIETPLSCK